MGIGSFLFGGGTSSASEQNLANTQAENARRQAFIEEQAAIARGDVKSILPTAAQNQQLGYQGALDVIGGAVKPQLSAFQQGNMQAQEALTNTLPQVQNAILGLGVDMSALQPRKVNVDTSAFSNIDLPDFISAFSETGALSDAPLAQSSFDGDQAGWKDNTIEQVLAAQEARGKPFDPDTRVGQRIADYEASNKPVVKPVAKPVAAKTPAYKPSVTKSTKKYTPTKAAPAVSKPVSKPAVKAAVKPKTSTLAKVASDDWKNTRVGEWSSTQRDKWKTAFNIKKGTGSDQRLADYLAKNPQAIKQWNAKKSASTTAPKTSTLSAIGGGGRPASNISMTRRQL